ncbi:WcaA Glycosyltransferases involved in cell wall biogenesis [Candidatus Pelagibacterales bacterium]
MKISIITITKNSEKTILETLNSIHNQTYKNIEHIVVDGGSTDKTLEYISKYPKKIKFVKQKKRGIYNAFNLGVEKATGQLIGILNSDDIYNNNKVIEKVAKISKKKNKDIYIGDSCYFNNSKFSKSVRYYSSQKFKPSHLKFGLMPAHTATFVDRKVFKKVKYNEDYLIAADYKFFVDAIIKKKFSYHLLKFTVTRMRTGGISGKNFFSYLLSTKEIIYSIRDISLFMSPLIVFLRGFVKIAQLYAFFDDKYFQRTESIYFKKNFIPDFNIVTSTKKLFMKNRNFILSALNLAYIGFYLKGDIKKNKYQFHWPDGNFSKVINSKLHKTPGRIILINLKIPTYIKKINILGNISINSINFLKNLYKRKIKVINLPYGSTEEIIKKVNNTLKKNQLTFITLPSPKQEQIAKHLSEKNRSFKIICIGGSISMLSGDEKPVPNVLSNFEFIWRLRTDPIRRINRLIISFFYFIKGFLTKKNRDFTYRYEFK